MHQRGDVDFTLELEAFVDLYPFAILDVVSEPLQLHNENAVEEVSTK